MVLGHASKQTNLHLTKMHLEQPYSISVMSTFVNIPHKILVQNFSIKFSTDELSYMHVCISNIKPPWLTHNQCSWDTASWSYSIISLSKFLIRGSLSPNNHTSFVDDHNTYLGPTNSHYTPLQRVGIWQGQNWSISKACFYLVQILLTLCCQLLQAHSSI